MPWLKKIILLIVFSKHITVYLIVEHLMIMKFMAIKIKTKLKRLILMLSGKTRHLKKMIKCKSVWYGNSYGGFYVFPGCLNANSIVYSFGIGEDISFDKAIIENHNCSVFGFDPTPKSINWVMGQKLPDGFKFFEYGINDKSGLVDFYLPKNPEHVSGSFTIQKNVDINEKVTVQMKSFIDITHELGHKHIDVLKMDIEGAEYNVLEDILNSKITITQILIEFHDRFIENGKFKSKQAIKKLKDNGFEIFAISDSFEEISFINKNLLHNG
jgi:FkbM family methyltransferase